MDLTTTIRLNSNSNDRFQYIYSSQLYGTFFNIYAKFIFNEELGKIEKTVFQIVNYKGLLNIGISDVQLNSSIVEKDTVLFEKYLNEEYRDLKQEKVPSKENILEMYKEKDHQVNSISYIIELQAFNPNIIFNLNEGVIIDQKENLYLIINRNLRQIEQSKRNIFDSEFEYRDGLREPLKLRRAYRNGRKEKDNENIKSLDAGIPKGSGGICPKGYSLIVF